MTYFWDSCTIELCGKDVLTACSIPEDKVGRGAASANIHKLTAKIKTGKIVVMRGITAMGAGQYRGIVLTLCILHGTVRVLAHALSRAWWFAHAWIASAQSPQPFSHFRFCRLVEMIGFGQVCICIRVRFQRRGCSPIASSDHALNSLLAQACPRCRDRRQ